MTPKEKAEELVKKFNNFSDGSFSGESRIYEEEKSRAKQCAIICVDEQIAGLYVLDEDEWSIWTEEREQFWKNVREELEKL